MINDFHFWSQIWVARHCGEMTVYFIKVVSTVFG